MWVKTVNRQFRMMNSVLFRKVDYRTLWSFNPETRSQPQTSPFQWGLLEEVPHLSVTVCETQRAFLSRLLFKFFFFSDIPSSGSGRGCVWFQMGPWGRMHCGLMGMPFLTPSLFPLLPPWPLPRTHPDRSELGGPTRQRHRPVMSHIIHTVCLLIDACSSHSAKQQLRKNT